jgi:hypothetical protein
MIFHWRDQENAFSIIEIKISRGRQTLNTSHEAVDIKSSEICCFALRTRPKNTTRKTGAVTDNVYSRAER